MVDYRDFVDQIKQRFNILNRQTLVCGGVGVGIGVITGLAVGLGVIIGLGVGLGVSRGRGVAVFTGVFANTSIVVSNKLLVSLLSVTKLLGSIWIFITFLPVWLKVKVYADLQLCPGSKEVDAVQVFWGEIVEYPPD